MKREKNEKFLHIVEEMNKEMDGITMEDIQESCGSHFLFPIYYGMESMKLDIGELELSQRSYNCLKRIGFHTIGDLLENVDRESDLRQIRNMGEKSAKEVMFTLFCYQFLKLSGERRKVYMQRVLSLNGISTFS